MDYETSFLRYTEFPADAERGLELIGGSVALLHSPSPGMTPLNPESSPGDIQAWIEARGIALRFYTPSSIILLPVPDFSMPYNVIILTSTIIALFFGSVMNGLIRAWKVVDLHQTSPAKIEKVANGSIEAKQVLESEQEMGASERRGRLKVE